MAVTAQEKVNARLNDGVELAKKALRNVNGSVQVSDIRKLEEGYNLPNKIVVRLSKNGSYYFNAAIEDKTGRKVGNEIKLGYFTPSSNGGKNTIMFDGIIISEIKDNVAKDILNQRLKAVSSAPSEDEECKVEFINIATTPQPQAQDTASAFQLDGIPF